MGLVYQMPFQVRLISDEHRFSECDTPRPAFYPPSAHVLRTHPPTPIQNIAKLVLTQ